MKAFLKIAAMALLLPAASIPLAAQQDYLSNWPAGRSPEQVGKALAEKERIILALSSKREEDMISGLSSLAVKES